MTEPVPLRLAVLGAGTISRAVHLPLIARSADVRLVAVADLDPAVLVATPGRHAELAVAALRAGKHVLAEKPLALSLAEIDEAAAAAAEHGRVLQVGYMKVHDAAVAAARAALSTIGDLRLVQVSVRHPLDAPQLAHLRLPVPGPLPEDARPVVEAAEAAEARALDATVGEQTSDRWRRLFRFVLCGSVIHELSVLRALGLDLPERPDLADVLAGDGAEPPTLVVSARISDDVRCLLDWVWTPDFPAYHETVRITGTSGEIELAMAPPYVLDASSRLRIRSAALGGTQDVEFGHDGAFQRQLESFVTAVRTGEVAPAATAAGARADLLVLRGILDTLRRTA